jgi:hypothetical protein
MVDASKEVAAFFAELQPLPAWKVTSILKMKTMLGLNVSATTYFRQVTYRLFYNIYQ